MIYPPDGKILKILVRGCWQHEIHVVALHSRSRLYVSVTFIARHTPMMFVVYFSVALNINNEFLQINSAVRKIMGCNKILRQPRRADKSAMGTMNRPLRVFPVYLVKIIIYG
jgi:hypothetical protein